MGSITTPGMTIGNPIINATAGSVLFAGAAGVLAQDNTNFNYATTAGPRLQIGNGTGASAGLILGHGLANNNAIIYHASLVPSATNYALNITPTITNINAADILNVIGQNQINFTTSTGTKMNLGGAGWIGEGLYITAGVLSGSAVTALSVTQTWNNAALAFPGVRIAFTDTASAAGAIAFQVLGGAAANTNLLKVNKTGLVDAPAYSVAGTPGANFGPAGVVSITVVNGIITAIS